MKKVQVDSTQLRIHFKAQTKVLDKAIRVVKEYNTGKVRPRRLGCGLFSVLDVSRNERIVIKDNTLNLMTHEQYNKFVERR
ncbi:hypothetical protein FDH34_gp026 [Serratia phage BF]|uniref:ParE-like toxin domain-containing protein n=3 Tax=Eneladusvirus BF TaxID=2560751 RepID=A0A7L8ZKL3_9CAUD|nr:hypothetical protein FDH34_gp026 [Serratia phage BF]QOI70964.1 hypothetical protein pEaSNUABM12_00026 [Erwinia phage pEa_SNUABM_12]QOI71509.1 putative structural protein [Erwinia phage pEa_SNUABM_47]QXO11172.1 hypothetical protein pEaSNUABM19_00026 [Erwinia phage pEa_SNUABM_19]QXO11720.1 hypothetical protein pEaSNUABM44_00024 [Erwinia phage pEa_SNUABM_44]QXO12271.1 hypothetical protein pEaSNUABM49_00025 [Erwinia phage pEa_SNUABM_49]